MIERHHDHDGSAHGVDRLQPLARFHGILSLYVLGQQARCRGAGRVSPDAAHVAAMPRAFQIFNGCNELTGGRRIANGMGGGATPCSTILPKRKQFLAPLVSWWR